MSAPIAGGRGRIPLAEAEALAAEVIELLAPACERIEVAGSIRRRKAEVGDLELVCVPKIEVARDLFGEPISAGSLNLLDAQVRDLMGHGVFGHRLDKNDRSACGEKYKRLIYQSEGDDLVALDLFSVIAPTQWGAIFTIRTGSADFSHKLVTSRLDGGWMPAGMQQKDGALHDRGALIETPEEEDFFDALGLPWLEPERRTPTVRLAPDRGKAWQWVGA